MREVSGTTWTFQLIIIFILIFACFLTLVLNYYKAYNVKNEMLTVIEKYEGVTEDSIDIINNIIRDKGYKNMGYCPNNEEEDWMGVDNYDGNYEKVQKGKKYHYCFRKVSQSREQKSGMYYYVKVFYKFNLPFIGDVVTFTINGRTNTFIGNPNSI